MFKINLQEQTPIYLQIVNQTKWLIYNGVLKKDDRLPSVRVLASILEVNPNTVSKAYQELEGRKIIYTAIGKGAFVNEINVTKEDNQKIQEELKALVKAALVINIDEKKFKNMVEDTYKLLKGVDEK